MAGSSPPDHPIADRLRKRQITGLLLLLAVILIASVFHAGLAQVFPHGWWHIW